MSKTNGFSSDGHLFDKALLVSTDEGILRFPHNLVDLPKTADSTSTVLVRGGKTVAMDFNYNGGYSIQVYIIL